MLILRERALSVFLQDRAQAFALTWWSWFFSPSIGRARALPSTTFFYFSSLLFSSTSAGGRPIPCLGDYLTRTVASHRGAPNQHLRKSQLVTITVDMWRRDKTGHHLDCLGECPLILFFGLSLPLSLSCISLLSFFGHFLFMHGGELGIFFVYLNHSLV